MRKEISDLLEAQQEAVLNCFKASKICGTRGRRYSLKWIYQCQLMRIKSPALYDHIRRHNILPLPCRETLDKYRKNLKSEYGFQDALFEVLKMKTQDWDEKLRHGTTREPSRGERRQLVTSQAVFADWRDAHSLSDVLNSPPKCRSLDVSIFQVSSNK